MEHNFCIWTCLGCQISIIFGDDKILIRSIVWTCVSNYSIIKARPISGKKDELRKKKKEAAN